jgi:hypothetical protein
LPPQNATTETVPIFDPDGNRGRIPADRLVEAVRAGAKPGVNVLDPDGNPGTVPADRVRELVLNGGKIVPFHQQEVQHPGFLQSLWGDVQGMATGLYHSVTDYDPLTDPKVPDDAKWKIAQKQAADASAKANARTQAVNKTLPGYGSAYANVAAPAAEMLGANVSGMEQSAEEGDTAGVLGHAAAVPVVTAATEGLTRGLPAAVEGVKGLKDTKVGQTAGVLAEATGKLPAVKDVVKAGKTLGKLRDIWGEKDPNVPYAGEAEPPATQPPVYPGAPNPTATPEQLNPAITSPARSLPGEIGPERIYGPRPTPAAPIPPREGLQLAGQVEEPPAPAAAAATPPPDTSPKTVEQQLRDALGARSQPVEPGVALRNQGKPKAPLPADFTPVDSSALRGYKYDPETREFHSITSSGQHYVHGDVSPEQVAAFEAADSKGKAWNDIRQNSPLVGKIVNGERVAAKPPVAMRSVVIDPATGRPEFSDVLAAKQTAGQSGEQPAPTSERSAGAGDNLEDLLRQSLEQAQQRKAAPARAPKAKPAAPALDQLQVGKGGVMTTAAPGDLTQRWGVDPQSLTAGREQTRGMSPQDTEASIAELAERYRKGQPVEPVMETRDANNNIIEVDGRARAIAAQRAGIERIPIMVRRLPAAAGEAPAPLIARSRRTIATAQTAPAGSVGAGETLSRPSQPGAPAASGADTTVTVPGEDNSYKARYQVRELADLQPSHSGVNFNANEKYALTNDRDYSNPLNQGKVVNNSAPGKFDPRYHITDNPDATNGPAVIDSDGHVLGGNGRTMILQRVHKFNPEGAAAYRDLLTQKAGQFGIDPKTLEGMKEPVLVRQLDDAELEGGGKQNAITDFNKSGTAAMTPAERAIADSKRISQGTLDDIAGRLDAEGHEATLADVLRGKSGTQILDKLIGDRVLTEQERAGLATGDALTEAGNERVRKLLVARFFKDPAMIDSTPASVRSKVENMTAPLARVDGVPGWDLTGHVQDAMAILEEARTHGIKNLDDLVSQSGLFGESKYSPEAVTMAKAIKDSSARTLQNAVKRYAADMADAHRPLLLGEKITPAQAFRDAFENPTPAKVRNAAAERAIGTESAPGLF